MENHKQKIKIGKGDTMRVMQRYAFLMFLFLALPVMAFSQTRTVRGTVTDTQGEAIPGASVTVNGTQRGTLTNVDGSFSIDASPNDRLTISFIGFLKQEIAVGNNTRLDITMKEDNTELEDVVVVGYGTQKKATLTGSVSSVASKEITVTKNENVVNMLAGKLPGLRVTQTSSRPGAFDSKFDIRGLGNPLIVIDGVPSDNDTFQRMDGSEIESVSILKDAAAAIYGLRSANGVVLVTTKRGASSVKAFEIQYGFNVGWQQFLHVPENVNAVQYMELVNEKLYAGSWFNTLTGNTVPHFTDANFQPYRDGTLQTTDWLGATFRNNAMQQQHNITMDGGSETVRYFFNLGYMNQESALRSNSMNYDRWNFRSNVDVNITKRLKASVSLGGYMDDMVEPGIDIWTVYKNVYVQQPHVPVYANNNPNYLNASPGEAYNRLIDGHPLANTNSDYVGENKYINRKFNGQLSLTYDIPGINGLSAKASYYYDFRDKDSRWFKKGYSLYLYNDTNDTYTPGGAIMGDGQSPSKRSVQRMDEKWENRNLQLSLNYNRTFNDVHNVAALVLFEDGYSTGDNFYAKRFISLNSEYLFAGDALGQVGSMNSGSPWDRSSQAFVGKFNYDYAGKYLLEIAGRYDGSSKFPKGSQWGLFGSVSAGWRISEETFFKESPLAFINNLKLKGSYGVMGDDGAASNYPTVSAAYQIAQEIAWIYGANGGVEAGLKPTSLPNPDLTWYTADMLNVGVEAEMWNGLLGGSFEYYVRNRDGLIGRSTEALPKTVGADMPEENMNSDRTFGYDVSVYHRNKIGDVEYNIGANMFATRNEWRDKLDQGPAGNSFENWKRRDNTNRYKDIWFVRNTLGQFQSFDQIYNFDTYRIGGGGGMRPGEYYYEDWNGDGIINDDDMQALATFGMPLFNYGFNIGAAYKGFDLNANFQGAAGIYYRYTETYAMPLGWNDGGTNIKFWDRWHPEDPAKMYDPQSKWIPGKFPVTTGGEYDPDGSTRIENASYVRLKSLEIGYTLPKNIVSKVGVKNMRVYVSGYNLLTFTGLDGMDPEHPGGQGGAIDGNRDKNNNDVTGNYRYPLNRTWNIGATIKF